MRPTVFLFDIDGTLISSGGVARRCIERAFAERYGSAATLAASFGGMTDRAIARDALSALAPELEGKRLEEEIDAVLDRYLQILEEEARSSAASFRVHDGIREALDRTLARPQSAVGLGTGNVRRGARLKLDCVGLFDFFAFGGFGCDHVDRARLLHIGAERGALLLGAPLAECRVVVIGDTPKDVAAAHAIGAECVAVTTGASTREELLASGARAVFRDLAAPGALELLLG
jgi:phosphoglycolate phosphatase-like HAD superfamily hydrolase